MFINLLHIIYIEKDLLLIIILSKISLIFRAIAVLLNPVKLVFISCIISSHFMFIIAIIIAEFLLLGLLFILEMNEFILDIQNEISLLAEIIIDNTL